MRYWSFKILSTLILAVVTFATSPAASQRLLWPGDAGYSGPRSCNVLDAECVRRAKAKAEADKQKPKPEAAKKPKRKIAKVKRPNPAISEWSSRGQPAPTSERLQVEVQPPVAAPEPAPTVPNYGSTELPKSEPKKESKKEPKAAEFQMTAGHWFGAGILGALVLLLISNMLGWRKKLVAGLATDAVHTDTVVIRPAPPSTIPLPQQSPLPTATA